MLTQTLEPNNQSTEGLQHNFEYTAYACESIVYILLTHALVVCEYGIVLVFGASLTASHSVFVAVEVIVVVAVVVVPLESTILTVRRCVSVSADAYALFFHRPDKFVQRRPLISHSRRLTIFRRLAQLICKL